MTNTNEIRAGRHCVARLHVHLVFVAKYRRRVFTKAILRRLKEIFGTVCNDFEAELVEFDGEDDHVHILVQYPPKVSGISSSLLARSTVVSQLLCRILWWRSN